MDYKIQIHKRAIKTLSSLPLHQKKQLSKVIDSLASNPYPPSAKCLHSHHKIWRIRKCNFRIAYVVQNEQLLILVVHIADRKEFYQQLKRIIG